MLTYSVGPEELLDFEIEMVAAVNPLWMVYWYDTDTDGGGYGHVVILRKDGRLDHQGISHCGCCGSRPLDDWSDDDSFTMTVEEFLRRPKAKCEQLVFEKVKELLQS